MRLPFAHAQSAPAGECESCGWPLTERARRCPACRARVPGAPPLVPTRGVKVAGAVVVVAGAATGLALASEGGGPPRRADSAGTALSGIAAGAGAPSGSLAGAGSSAVVAPETVGPSTSAGAVPPGVDGGLPTRPGPRVPLSSLAPPAIVARSVGQVGPSRTYARTTGPTSTPAAGPRAPRTGSSAPTGASRAPTSGSRPARRPTRAPTTGSTAPTRSPTTTRPTTTRPTPTRPTPTTPTTQTSPGTTLTTSSPSSAGSSRSSAGSPAAIPLRPRDASTYNPDQASASSFGVPAHALGGPRSAWTYRLDPSTGGRALVGLLVRLPAPSTIHAVALRTDSPGMAVALYGSTGAVPSTLAGGGWTRLATRGSLLASTTITVTSQARFSAVLVWIQRAPPNTTVGTLDLKQLELFAG